MGAHELGGGRDEVGRNVQPSAGLLQHLLDVVLGGVRIVQPEGGNLGRRIEQAEQPLRVGDTALAAPLAPVPPAALERVTPHRLPDVQQMLAWLDLHPMPLTQAALPSIEEKSLLCCQPSGGIRESEFRLP